MTLLPLPATPFGVNVLTVEGDIKPAIYFGRMLDEHGDEMCVVHVAGQPFLQAVHPSRVSEAK